MGRTWLQQAEANSQNKARRYEIWLRRYVKAFADEADMSVSEAASICHDSNITEHDFRRDMEPERAGRKAARYALYGEQ